MFSNLGPMEITLIILIIVILFGAKKIPDLAQGIGKGLKEFKKAIKDVEDDVKNSTNDKKTEEKKDK